MMIYPEIAMAPNPNDLPRDHKAVTMADTSGWPPYLNQPDPEHLDRLGLMEKPGPAFRQAILDEASAAITGAREDTYGGPETSFLTIAKFWSAYLDHFVDPHDVAAMMALMKLARLKHSEGQHRDSWVDLAGYAACGAEVAQDRHP